MCFQNTSSFEYHLRSGCLWAHCTSLGRWLFTAVMLTYSTKKKKMGGRRRVNHINFNILWGDWAKTKRCLATAKVCALEPKRRQPLPNLSSPMWCLNTCLSFHELSPEFTFLKWNKRSWSSYCLGLFHVPGPSLAIFQIGEDIPLAPGPHHLSAVRTVYPLAPASWTACALMVIRRSTGCWWSMWGGHQSCQRALASHWQLLPAMNIKTGPGHTVCVKDEKRLKALTFKQSMICWT